MRAIGVDFESGHLAEQSLPLPQFTRDDEVLFRVREVGVCGTDRELAHRHLGRPPAGESVLVLGHEALGQVVEVGPAIRGLRPGDWVAPQVRRPCEPPCRSCARLRTDLCVTGTYTERGIWGRHGYWTEYAVDAEHDLVRVPPELVDVAVLLEPLSTVEKAIERAFSLHEGSVPESALVLGAGPIGILAALALQLRGVRVQVYSLEPPDHPRARLLEHAGVRYSRSFGERADIIVEATGAVGVASEAVEALAPLGVYAVLGIGNEPVPLRLRALIFGNQVIFGSVNASPASFAKAVEDLGQMDRAVVRQLIQRFPFDDVASTIYSPHSAAPKLVHVVEESVG